MTPSPGEWAGVRGEEVQSVGGRSDQMSIWVVRAVGS